MSSKQRLALVAPLILIAVMYPVFQLLSGAFGENWRIGWYLGLAIYWLIWGAAFPLWIIGKASIAKIIRPQRLNVRVSLLVLFLLLMASLYRFIPGMEYQKLSLWILLLLLSTNFGNGFFEEVLWRGVYMELFPDSILFRIVWPSIWFGLWHLCARVSFSGRRRMGSRHRIRFDGLLLEFHGQKDRDDMVDNSCSYSRRDHYDCLVMEV